jgi:hypothetical protein
MLKDLSKIDFKKYQIEKVVFRCHPSLKYSSEEISSYFKNYKIEDNTAKPIEYYNNKTIIMFSGPTTGVLELLSGRVALIWMPYIWKDGLLFDDVMKEVGEVTKDYFDLNKKAHELMNNEELLNSTINFYETNKNNFISHDLISTQIKKNVLNA